MQKSQIRSPICLICACKFPFVSSREVNEINWMKPFSAVSSADPRIHFFMGLSAFHTRYMFGLDEYLENYGTIQKRKVHLGDDAYRSEFGAWLLTTPFSYDASSATWNVDIVCCPADRKCANWRCGAKTKKVCAECEVPICRGCEASLASPFDILLYGTIPQPPARVL